MPLRTSVLLALALLIASPAFADDSKPTGSNSGTAPDNRGATGWTGGTRDQQQPDDPVKEAREASDQPWMAEGLDLKGEPRQFSPKKTVE